jgi:pimeloyl-ACP methyl ester carboxylesterase
VIVPDHMGFGKSETPPDREYTLRTHEGPVVELPNAGHFSQEDAHEILVALIQQFPGRA